MNKKFICILLASLMTIAGFFAIKTQAAANERVDYLREQKIVVGDENGDLKLDENIRRNEFAKIVVYAIGAQDRAETLKGIPSIFKDMKTTDWANGFVNLASTEKIVQGYPDKTFRPVENVTYEEAIKMMTVVALGRDLTAEEKASEQTWSAPYILKANELGILKHLKIEDYKAPAVREDVFDILYEVLMLKKAENESTSRGIVKELTKEGAKVLVLKPSDKLDFKVDDEVTFKFADSVNTKDLLGMAVDFTLDKEGMIINAKVAPEYEVMNGQFDIQKDRLYMNGNKSGYDILKDAKERDRLVNIVHNDESYSYDKYVKEIKKADFAQVTIHNSKVVFIRSFNFKDIAPVSSVKGGDIYIIKDTAPNAEAKQPVNDVYKITRDGLKSYDPMTVAIDSLLHIYGNNNAIVTEETLDDVNFKLEKKDGMLNFVVNKDYYPISNERGFRGVVSINSKEYKVIPNDENDATLNSMKLKKNIIFLDLLDRVQFVRGDFSQSEETMVVDAVATGEVRLMDRNNRKMEIKDELGLTILDGKKVIKMSELNVGDLVYVFQTKDKVSKIALVAKVDKEAMVVDRKDGELAINLAPSRGRFAIIDLEGKTYELAKDTNVLVEEGKNISFRTLEYVKRYASEKELKAVIVTDKEFKDLGTGAAIPGSDRDDLLHTIVFKNFEESMPIEKTEILKLKYGFEQAIDKTMTGMDVNGDEHEYSIYKNAKIEKLNAEDIVKVFLTKEGEIARVERLIPNNYRVYTVTEYTVKDGVTSIVLDREGETNIKKFIAKDATLFGTVEVGSKLRMHTMGDDIDVLVIVK